MQPNDTYYSWFKMITFILYAAIHKNTAINPKLYAKCLGIYLYRPSYFFPLPFHFFYTHLSTKFLFFKTPADVIT